MLLAQIGGVLIIVACAAFAFLLYIFFGHTFNDGPAFDGPAFGGPALVFGIGAAIVSVAQPRPLDGRFTRAGLRMLAVGALSIALVAVLGAYSDVSGFFWLIAYLMIPAGFLVTGIFLAQLSGLPRAVGFMLLVGPLVTTL